MKFRSIVSVLLPMFVAMAFTVGCERKNDDGKDARAQAAAEIAKSKAKQEESAAKIAELEKLDAENKAALEKLNADIKKMENDRARREGELVKANKDYKAQMAMVEQAKELHAQTQKQIAEDKAKLVEEQNAVNAKIQQQEADLAKLKADNQAEIEKQRADSKAVQDQVKAELDKRETATHERIAELELEISKNQARSQELDAYKTQLDEQNAESLKKNEELKAQEAALQARKDQMELAFRVHKELIEKSGKGDIFEKIEMGKNQVWLIRLIGSGHPEYIKDVRQRISALNGVNGRYKSFNNVSNIDLVAAVSSSVPTEDTYLVEATGQAVLDLRDSVEKMLNDKDSAGELARFTSLWVIPRLVEEVRVGMRLQVIGSDSKQFEGRSSRLIADLPLRTATTTVRGLSDLDLTKPGSYVFATEKDAQACKVVNAACFEALANAKFLDREQTITMPTLTGDVTKKGTYRDILADMMGYSIEQTYNDIKSKTVLGVSLDKYDKMTWNMDWTPVLDKYGFADRAAVVEDFQLAYTVSMVDRIGTVTLLDGYAFLNSGRVGNGKVFDSESLKRGEVLVELPITQFKESRSALQDLYLKDFSPKTRLLEKSDEHKKLLAKAEKGELTLDDERRLVDLNYEYSRNAEESAEKILSEQREEFGRRNMINTGKLDDMIKVLKGN